MKLYYRFYSWIAIINQLVKWNTINYYYQKVRKDNLNDKHESPPTRKKRHIIRIIITPIIIT